MAISDEIFMLGLGFILNYVLLYRKNKLLGSIAFVALSAITMSSSTDPVMASSGLVILLISSVSTLYSLFPLNAKRY